MAKIANYVAGGSFNAKDAIDKQIVAMVKPALDNKVEAAGIIKQTSNGYMMTVEKKENEGTPQEKTVQENYIFDAAGEPVSSNAITGGYKLKMADTKATPVDSTVANSAGVVYNRTVSGDGTVTYTEIEGENGIDIDTLNARDQFAIQILRSLLDKTKDPSKLSTTEVAYYCDTAYTWAGYMMKESSQARAIIKDTNSTTNIQEVPVGYLADNTEKLLNNIAAALDKTNAKITVGQEVNLEAERITIPELNKLIEDLKTLQENYVKDGNSTVGLKDLISTLSTTLTSLKTITSIGSINSLPDIEGNINSSVSGTITATLSRGSSSSNPLYVSIPSTLMDTRIKAWLNATKDSNGGNLTVPSSI